MSIPPHDWTVGLPLASGAAVEAPPRPSAIEEEIIGLYDQFRGRLLRYILSFGVAAQDAEEIIQEVFLALFHHLNRGKSRQNLRGWIFRVAHNLALKHRYASQRAFATVETDEALAAKQPDPSPNPEDAMAGSQRLQRLHTVLRALPLQDQCCLYLRAEGLRYREIAEVLGMSLGAVSISLTQSLARFRRADEGSRT
jgi:RNA polymerase sigma-70 factor (ECF subfamily)